MFAALGAWLARPAVKAGGLALAAGALALGTWLILHGEYDKGAAAGGARVTTAVQGEAIKRTHEAVQRKEKADAEVSRTPYRDLVDGLD